MGNMMEKVSGAETTYPQSRLDEALSVVGPDIARRKKEEEEKKAKNTYREQFNTRQGVRKKYASLYHGDSDNDDDEYDPDNSYKKKARLSEDSAQSNEKRRKPVSITGGDQKRQKRAIDMEVLPNSLHQPFLTLKLPSSDGKELLAKLADKHQTHLNTVLNTNNTRKNLIGAGFEMLSANGSTTAPHEKYTLSLETKEDSGDASIPRALRNGKVHEAALNSDCERQDEEDVEMLEGTIVDKGKSVVRSTERRCLDTDTIPEDRQGVPCIHTGVGDWDSFSDDEQWEPLPRPDGKSRDTAIHVGDSDSEANKCQPESSKSCKFTQNRPKPEFMRQDERALDHAGQIFTIKTAFAHPIDFQSLLSCDFCSDYRFGIMGYGMTTTTVAYNPEKLSEMIELGDGHAVRRPLTRMCVQCAVVRMQTGRCKSHVFENITSQNVDDIYGPYIDHLSQWGNFLDGNAPIYKCGNPPVLDPCHICISPASWKCCCYQARNMLLEPCRVPDIPLEVQSQQIAEENPGMDTKLLDPIRGCGLKLCHDCHDSLAKLDFVMEDKEKVFEAVGGTQDFKCIRADFSFLFQEGPIWEAYSMPEEGS